MPTLQQLPKSKDFAVYLVKKNCNISLILIVISIRKKLDQPWNSLQKKLIIPINQ